VTIIDADTRLPLATNERIPLFQLDGIELSFGAFADGTRALCRITYNGDEIRKDVREVLVMRGVGDSSDRNPVTAY
jgi:hypothetical protein